MDHLPPHAVTPFVFSDPAGKRWPRLRLVLLISGILFLLGTVVFVQALFVAPQMRVPFTLRQLKGQLKALRTQNPGRPTGAALFWQKFGRPGRRRRKRRPPPRLPPLDRERKRRITRCGSPSTSMAILTASHRWSSTPPKSRMLCPEWMAVADGTGELQIDADPRLPKLAANKGIALMPLLTNLGGDRWQPEAIENLAHGSAERQQRFISEVLNVLRNAKAAGVVVDWEQIDPAYKRDITAFLEKFADALHEDGKELWLCVQPGQELDYIDFDVAFGERRSLRGAAVRRDIRHRCAGAAGFASLV